MGVQLSWIAVKDGSMDEVLDRLGLEVIGEATDELGEDFLCARSDQGWSIVVMKKWPKKPDETTEIAAPSGSSLCGMMTEIAMFSELRGYENGRLTWYVTRDCDKGRGVIAVRGSPPAPFEDIKRGLEAKQVAAGDERVDYLFDLPQDLSVSLCGYGPYEGFSEWQVLGRKGKHATPRPRPTATAAPYHALVAATEADLLPLLWSLGWSKVNDPPILTQGDQIVREIGTQKQTILFDYGNGHDAYMRVVAWTTEPTASGMVRFVRAYGGDVPLPFWKRFSWRRFWQMTQAPAPTDPIGAVIEQARADIFDIEAYLKTGVRAPRVQIDSWERPPA
jgi:hypothetical protein